MGAASPLPCYLASLPRDLIADLSAGHEGVWGNGDIAPLATNFGSRWTQVVSFANWLLYRRQKKPRVPCWVGPTARLVTLEYRKASGLCRKSNQMSSQPSHNTDYAIPKPKSGRYHGSLRSNDVVRSTASSQAIQSTLNSIKFLENELQ